MKKEEFVKLGMDEELAAKCEAASMEELKGFIPKSRFDEVNNAKNTAEALVKERDAQIEEVKKSVGNNEELKRQIEDLQKSNKAKDEAHAAEIMKLQREAVDNELLTAAHAKNSKAVLGLLEAIGDDVDIDTYRTKRSEQLNAVKKSDEYLFEAKESKTKLKGVTPGQGADTKLDGLTKEQFNKMSYKEKVNLFNENKEMYDSLSK